MHKLRYNQVMVIAMHPLAMPATDFYTAPKVKEKFDERIVTMAPASMASAIDKEAASNGETRSDVIRRALELYYNPIHAEVTTDEDELENLPVLDVRVACGVPTEARQEAEIMLISKAVADDLSFKDGDFAAYTRGESMTGAGILDEFLVLFEPLKTGRRPQKNKIALVRITDAENNVSGTLKRWVGEGEKFPRLVDGDGKAFEYPADTASVEPVAIAKGVIGALP